MATPAEIDRNLGGKGYSFAATLGQPHSRQRVFWGQRGPSGRHGCQMTDDWSECTQMVTVPGIWPPPPAPTPGSDVSATLTTSPFLHSSLDFYEREKETFHFLK